ncbi:MAG: MlaD family protein [Burkholderiaceae bacterium]|jgi:phospholipid/cholesterol/gamma-HCH transport system substrate-binding protein
MTVLTDEQVGRRAKFLIGLTALLLVGAIVFILHARGAFESSQRLTLITDDSEGATVGMSLTFAGFQLGRVTRIRLGEDGNAHIEVDIPQSEAHWLKVSSVFTLERNLLGGTKLKAYSGILEDPLLPDGAVRPLLRGDATADIPKVAGTARELLENLQTLTGSNSPLVRSLEAIEVASQRLASDRGALAVLMGNTQGADQLQEAIGDLQQLIAATNEKVLGLRPSSTNNSTTASASIVGPANAPTSTLESVNKTLQATEATLRKAQESLTKLDAVLDDTKAITRNARAASQDLELLRYEVEASLRTADELMRDVQRVWPLSQDPEKGLALP